MLGLFGFLALAWRAAIAPIDPPAATSFPAELIALGKILAGAGYCVVCYTRLGGAPFAGTSASARVRCMGFPPALCLLSSTWDLRLSRTPIFKPRQSTSRISTAPLFSGSG